MAKAGQVIDVTLAGTRPEVMRAVLDEVLAMPEVGLAIAAIGSSAQFHPELAADALAAYAGNDKPVAAFLVPEAPETARALAARGIATFRTPEACADAVAALLGARMPAPLPRPDGAAADAVRAAAEAPDAERAARSLVEALGIPAVPEVTIAPGEAAPGTLPFDWPVALKLRAPGLAHKTEAGGVRLGIADPDELEAARAEMARAAQAHGIQRPVFSVQPMACGLGEVLLGFHVDPSVGPVVTVGAGGVLSEIYGDAVVELAPVSADQAMDMITRVRGLAPLRGYRGALEGDLAALADAVAAFSQLAAGCEEYAVEAEINPLIVREAGAGVVAVDWLASVTPKRDNEGGAR